ncbi:MAG: hypothetical protein Q7Q71_01020 [Verrucomicrobiota bacterium JB023]|nr:hypothetical protein [Verrucomicrobiota bacterium JB023]
MKSISSLILLLCLLASGSGHAQRDPATVCFVRLVNLVSPGEGNLKLKIDGDEPWPAGYRLGQRTGGFGLSAGTSQFVLSKEGCLSADRKISLPGGETITLAVYAEPVEDEEGQLQWQIKVAKLTQQDPGDGYHLTVVSFCREAKIPLEVAPASDDSFAITVDRLKTTKVKFASSRERVAIVHDGDVIDVLKGRKAGNYVVMVFDAEEGKDAVSFYDPKFVLAN